MHFIIWYFLVIVIYLIFSILGPNYFVKVSSNIILLLNVLPFAFFSFQILKIRNLPYFILFTFLFVSSIILTIANTFRVIYYFLYNEFPFENPPYNIFWFAALFLALFISILFLNYFKRIIFKSKIKNYSILLSLIFVIFYIVLIYYFKEILLKENLIIFIIYYGIGGAVLFLSFFMIIFFLKGKFAKYWIFTFLSIILAVFGRISFEIQYFSGNYYPGSYTSLFFALSYLSLSLGSYKIYYDFKGKQ
jgi:hypothetical protein